MSTKTEDFETHQSDIIVFATQPVVSSVICYFVAQGFFYNRTGNSKNETVTTIFNDGISFHMGGTTYFIGLAHAISYTIQKEAYVKIAGQNYCVTPDILTKIETIPEPIAVLSGGLDGPELGWAGATRNTLRCDLIDYGNKALLKEMEEYLAEARTSERKRNVKKVLQMHGIIL